MPTYLFAYSGGSRPQSEEEGEQVMAAWMGWLNGLGSAVVDIGKPLAESRTVGTSADGGSKLTGYSVIEADNLDAAVALTDGCPQLDAGGSVEVYEAYEVM